MKYDNNHKLDVARFKCEKSLLFFTRYFFKQRFGRKFVVNEHHELICKALERTASGECNRLIINIAPRYGKTEIAVKNFIAWSLAKNPAARFIHLSYSDDLALDNSEEVKDLVISEEYHELFPEVQIKKDSKAKKKWYTTESGGVYATSAAGQVTGFGAGKVDDDEAEIDLFGGAIVIDDPIKPEDADSTTRRDRINQRFDSTIRNRVNSRNTPIIIIMQRLHPEDLCGYLIDQNADEWEVLSLPCIKPDGEALWPFKHTLEELEKLRRDNPTVFDRQYMQDPQPAEGLIWPREELQYFTELPPKDKWDIVAFYSDPADEGMDHHSMPVLILCEQKVYVADVMFTQDNLTVAEPIVVKKAREWNPDIIWIESNNHGAIFIRDLRKKVECSVYGIRNQTKKVSRMLAQEGFVKDRFMFKRDFNPQGEYGKFMKQIWNILRSGEETKDDAPDSIAGAAFMMRRNYSYLFYNDEEEEKISIIEEEE